MGTLIAVSQTVSLVTFSYMALLEGTLEYVCVLSMVREVLWDGPWMNTLCLLVLWFTVYQ